MISTEFVSWVLQLAAQPGLDLDLGENTQRHPTWPECPTSCQATTAGIPLGSGHQARALWEGQLCAPQGWGVRFGWGLVNKSLLCKLPQ